MVQLTIAESQVALASWQQQCRARDAARAQIEDASRIISTSLEVLESKRAELSLLSSELANATACETVLGLKGVRAAVLARTLTSLETASNSWCSRFFDAPVRLELRPYSLKKSGVVSDAIGLTVSGLGNATYASLSAGERRRVDLALILALGQLAGSPGTMFFDELFDTLDDSGIERADIALAELAADRCVLLISHRLLGKLSASRHICIEAGRIVK
jgi:DNA repair exonuclease SbcCD ATPase subunit